MNIKSIQQSLVLMLIIFFTVVSSQCPCATNRNISVEKCEKDLKCFESHKGVCGGVSEMFFKKALELTECKTYKICLVVFSTNSMVHSHSIKTMEDVEKIGVEDVIKIYQEKFPCTKKLEENNCENKIEARECIKEMLPDDDACAINLVEDCRINLMRKGPTKSANSDGKGSNDQTGAKSDTKSSNNEATTESSGAPQFSYFVGIIITLLMI